jgi:hypothetical protein
VERIFQLSTEKLVALQKTEGEANEEELEFMNQIIKTQNQNTFKPPKWTTSTHNHTGQRAKSHATKRKSN